MRRNGELVHSHFRITVSSLSRRSIGGMTWMEEKVSIVYVKAYNFRSTTSGRGRESV